MPKNGRVIQNIIHGCDTVMSHITHLYHLSALDFINTTSYPGMAPWTPSYTVGDMLPATGTTGGSGSTAVANSLVLNYVTALEKRRKIHTASALFSGRHPIQNAIVPGGVTTMYCSTVPGDPASGNYDQFGPFNASTTKSKFKVLLNDVRAFIDTKYIPDVVTVANQFSQYWGIARGCQRLLSYGDYPTNSTGTLFLKRGIADVLSPVTFSQTSICEYVDYSNYQYGVLDAAGLHPFSGRTDPKMSDGKYSWLKAPRMLNSGNTPKVCEVGPLARMVVTHASATSQQTVTNSAASGPLAASGSFGATYNASKLITTALSLCTKTGGVNAPTLADLYSPLGRHAARALEAKYLADAMAIWVDQLDVDQPCYTYKAIPKQISTGYGLAEAPRGALGHWIKIQGRKVAKYQCVVPSTWNFSPRISPLTADHGAVEQALIGVNIGTADVATSVINILRVVHPFDCCIACAVHVVNAEGKEWLKFAIGPDGKPANVEVTE